MVILVIGIEFHSICFPFFNSSLSINGNMESDLLPPCRINLFRIDKIKAATEPASNPRNVKCDECDKAYKSPHGLWAHKRKHNPGNKRHKCGGSCPSAFFTSTELKSHRLIHTGEKPHSCSQCERNFSLLGNLRRHVRELHGSGVKSFGCWCGAKFKSADTLRAHGKGTHSARRFPCEDCDKTYRSKLGLECHVATTHMVTKLLECKPCNKQFAHRSRFLHHQREKHGTAGSKTYNCTYCLKSYSEPGNLRRHIRGHLGEKPYGCSFCSKHFATRTTAKEHEKRMHTNEKPFSCDACDRSFSSTKDLRAHRNQAHASNQQQFACSQCDRTYHLLQSLKSHERATHQKRDDVVLRCQFCPFATKWLSNFRRHVRTHTGEKTNPCSICGKYFSSIGNMKQHLGTHAQARNFPCGKCTAKFKTKSAQLNHTRLVHNAGTNACQLCPKMYKCKEALARHIRTHTGEKPFACGKCDKRCLMATELKIHHQLRHTDPSNRKTFNCDICSLKLSRRGTLRRHKLQIHAAERERFQCEFCEKSFSRKDNLEMHIRTHTGEN